MLLAAIALTAALGAATVAIGQTERKVFLPAVATPGSAQTELHTGRATYYWEANGDGNCMFGPSPDDLMVAAISHVDYGTADYCGAYVEVYGPDGTIQVRVVDKCPDAGCLQGHLDLSPQAFAKIAAMERGIVPITWRVISPELGRNVAYHIKPGSNQWWTAIQVRYHRNPMRKMEYRNGGGQWVALERQDYNYFVGTNMGPGPYTLRITDTYGNVLEDSGIPLSVNVELPGHVQFPAGP
jgi:expansin (peptidoglycan-binding protein)